MYENQLSDIDQVMLAGLLTTKTLRVKSDNLGPVNKEVNSDQFLFEAAWEAALDYEHRNLSITKGRVTRELVVYAVQAALDYLKRGLQTDSNTPPR